MIRMLEDHTKELLEIRKRNRENEDTINKLMKQLKIKNAQQAKENGSYKEWCCGDCLTIIIICAYTERD